MKISIIKQLFFLAIIIACLILPQTSHAARLWSSGFELQSVTGNYGGPEWISSADTVGAPTIDTTIKRSGAASLRVTPTAATAYVIHTYAANTFTGNTYARFYLYISTAPSADGVIIARLYDATGLNVASIRLNTARTLELWKDQTTAAQQGSDSSALSLATWYRIEIFHDNTNDLLTAYIDGVEFATGISGTGNPMRLYLGAVSTQTSDLYFDDVAINDGSGTAQTGLPGAGSIVHLWPNGNGDRSMGDSGPSTETQNVVTGETLYVITAGEKYGFTYKPGTTSTLTQVDLYLYKYAGTTNDIVVELWSATSAHLPDTKLADLGSILAANVDATYAYRDLTIASPPNVTAGTEYVIVFYPSGGSGNYATYHTDMYSGTAGATTYGNILSLISGVWYPGRSINFKTYIDSGLDKSKTDGTTAAIVGNTSYHAFQITAGSTGSMTSIVIPIYLYASSLAAANVQLWSDSNDMPGSMVTNGDFGRVPYTSMDATYTDRTFTPATAPSVTNGTKYWVVWWKDNTDGAGNIAIKGNYAGNLNRVSSDSGSTWLYQLTMFKTHAIAGYTMVDESPTPDDATTYWELITANDILDVNCQASSEAGINSYDTITLIQVGIRHRAETASTMSMTPRIKSQGSGTVASGTAFIHDDVNSWKTNGDIIPQNYKLTSYTDPQLGGAWTPALLDTMQIGVTATDATPDAWISTLWALVEYTAGTPPAGAPRWGVSLKGMILRIMGRTLNIGRR